MPCWGRRLQRFSYRHQTLPDELALMKLSNVTFQDFRKGLLQPELLLIPLAFAFHFTWEMLQDPLYAGLAERPHGEVRTLCLMATLGDVVITVVAFYAAALAAGSRIWFLDATYVPNIAWFSAGLLIAIALEMHAINENGRWSYSSLMPVIPVLRIGVAPILQWIALPAILLLLMTRCFRATQKIHARCHTT